MKIDLNNKAIIITGASSGIGRATAIACAQAGMNVVLSGRRLEKLEEAAEQVKQAGAQAEIAPGDVAEAGHSEALLARAHEAFGGYHAVFANAGYSVNLPVLDMSMDDIRTMFEVNFFAAVDLVTRAAEDLIERHQPGHLLMCSSCLSKFSLAKHGPYAATKAAQDSMCEAMRYELAHKSIHVSSVHPITTTTEFFDTANRNAGMDESAKTSADFTPGLFVQTPERVARAVVKCLRTPRPEVWTSRLVLLSAGMMTGLPRFRAWMMRKQSRKMEKG